MTKQHFLIAAAAVLLAAVLCTAGCVNTPDEIVGDWLSETEYAVFAEDGTGLFAADEDSVLTLTWTKDGSDAYTFLFADGTAKTAVLDALRGAMTVSDGSVFEKQASGVSGLFVAGFIGSPQMNIID